MGVLGKLGEHAPLDRLAYCGLIYVGDDEKTAAEGANKMMWYMQANKVADHWKNPPGYHPPVVSANVLRGAHVSGSGAAGDRRAVAVAATEASAELRASVHQVLGCVADAMNLDPDAARSLIGTLHDLRDNMAGADRPSLRSA